MNEDELEELSEGLQRVVGNEIVGLGFVPDSSVLMLILAHEVTAYIRVENGALHIDIEAPTLQ